MRAMRASSLIFGVMALAVGVDALAEDVRRMGEPERIRFRAELLRQDLLRQDISAPRPAPSARPEAAAVAGGGAPAARLSPEERRALREQLRQNAVPLETRSPRRPR
jgi:hypothetical protein